jgi:glycosyltransferase involved in cell wall biosynthesis
MKPATVAQACKVPVIISDFTGIREAVDPGKSALVVPPDDEDALTEAMLELIQNSEKRKAMGAAGFEYVRRHFDIRNCAKKYLDIYESVISS